MTSHWLPWSDNHPVDQNTRSELVMWSSYGMYEDNVSALTPAKVIILHHCHIRNENRFRFREGATLIELLRPCTKYWWLRCERQNKISSEKAAGCWPIRNQSAPGKCALPPCRYQTPRYQRGSVLNELVALDGIRSGSTDRGPSSATHFRTFFCVSGIPIRTAPLITWNASRGQPVSLLFRCPALEQCSCNLFRRHALIALIRPGSLEVQVLFVLFVFFCFFFWATG